MKISDFGTSQQWSEHSTKMSFAGTVAWMAPEIIRNEPCNEKVDIWSFGVCLWELLNGEVPYKNVDSSAIIWGVGSNSLQLPLPSSCPEGFKLLIKQCWSAKPRNRPSFKHILMHLDIAAVEILSFKPEDYFRTQQSWKAEVWEYNERMRGEGSSMPVADEALVKKREEELKHAQDIREHYERKLARTTNLYLELNAEKLRVEQLEREIYKREKMLITSEKFAGSGKKKARPSVRIQRKPEISFIKTPVSPLRSTSPDSPTHLGAAAIRPRQHSEPRHGEAGQLVPGSGQSSVHHHQYHPTVEKLQQKKTRHRRSGSHGSSSAAATPRSSPKTSHAAAADIATEEAGTQTQELECGAPGRDTAGDAGSDYFSMSRQTSGRRSDKSFSSLNTTAASQCCCPGCPGNVGKEQNLNDDIDDDEDHLDDLEKKASEMMNKDSRRSSYHDLARKITRADLSSSSPRSPATSTHHVVEFEEDGKESSVSSVLESSQEEEEEDLAQAWTEDEDGPVLRRRSLLRRPVRAKSRSSFLSVRRSASAVSVASSEEGEVSEYVSSKRSTLDSNCSAPAADNTLHLDLDLDLELDLGSDPEEIVMT